MSEMTTTAITITSNTATTAPATLPLSVDSPSEKKKEIVFLNVTFHSLEDVGSCMPAPVQQFGRGNIS